MKFEFESELALKAVSTASEKLLEYSTRSPFNIQRKESNRDIVTEADQEIEKHISCILKKTNHCILGEESNSKDKEALQANETWVVDPIDGTANFVSGLPFVGVSVGLLSHKEPTIGAVALPFFKELFFTHGTQGAYMNGKRLQISGDVKIEDALIASSFSGKEFNDKKRKQQYELFGILNDSSRGCLRTGSAAVNICYVAAGKFHAAYGIGVKIWDVAGGLAIAKQAGTKVYLKMHPDSFQVSYVVGYESVANSLWNQIQEIE